MMADVDSSVTAVATHSGEATSLSEDAVSPEAAQVTASYPLDALDPGVAALCIPLPGQIHAGLISNWRTTSVTSISSLRPNSSCPKSFFNVLDGMPFDPTSVDIGGQLEAVKPMLARTRDIRLLTMQARLQILNHDLAGFAVSVAAVAYWLDAFWVRFIRGPKAAR